MAIISWQFALFVAIVVSVYYALPYRFQNIWLLIASSVFYAWLGWQFIIVLVLLVAFNLLITRRLITTGSHQRQWLWLGIGINVLALLILKYFDFFKQAVLNTLAWLHIPADETLLTIILPIGFSFTILQTISFLVDVSRKQIKSLPGIIDFALFISYFPKLSAGPIERARTFLPKLAAHRVVDNETLTTSFSLIMVGLFRKIVIADQIASLMPSLQFWRPLVAAETGADSLIYLFAYGFYLFNDFAGYTSIARGVSGLLGISLSPNFLTPYFSRTFTEFWNQWHITLSEWLRDYIYFPLTRFFLRRNTNPRFVLTLVIPPLVTMIVSGLWHEVSITLLIWGALHGIYLIIERVIVLNAPASTSHKQPLALQIISAIGIYLLVNIAWIPFHTTELVRMQRYFESLLKPGWPKDSLPMLNFIVISLILDVLQHTSHNELFFLKWPKPAQVAMLTGVSLLLIIMSSEILPAFVYQGF